MLVRTGVFLPIEIRWVWMPTIWMIGGEDDSSKSREVKKEEEGSKTMYQ